MPRRHYPISPTVDPDAELTAEQIAALESKDFWDSQAALTDAEEKVSIVYVYRLDPPIVKDVKDGKNKAIDEIEAHLFNRDLLVSKHGGGKYQLYHNSKLEGRKYNFKRIVTIPGIPARIYPNHILVDGKGDPVALPTAATAASGTPETPTKDDIRAIIREATAAAKTGNDATQEALKASINLVTTGAAEALKFVADAKTPGDSSALEGLRAELIALRTEMQNRERQFLEQQITELKAKLEAPPANPRGSGELNSVSETAKLFGVEGGLMGLVKALSGGDKEDMWEYGAKKVADAVATFIVDNGPSLTAWLRERTHVQHLEVLTKRQQSNMPEVQPPAPATPTAPAPRLTPASAPAQPQADPAPAGPPEMTGEQVMELLTKQVPATIRYYWDRNYEGGAVAEIVKGNFKPWLPLLRAQFNDLAKVIELAKADPQLAPITAADDFEDWAKQFFEEFHRVEPDETAPPAGGQTTTP